MSRDDFQVGLLRFIAPANVSQLRTEIENSARVQSTRNQPDALSIVGVILHHLGVIMPAVYLLLAEYAVVSYKCNSASQRKC